MRRSPSVNDLQRPNRNESTMMRAFHDDSLLGGMSTSRPDVYSASNYPPRIPGDWPSSPPVPLQTRPSPRPPATWNPPPQPPVNYTSNPASQGVPDPDDFLDMPEPSNATVPLPPPPLPPRKQNTPTYQIPQASHNDQTYQNQGQQWLPNDPRRNPPQSSPNYGPLDSFPSALSAGLAPYNSAPALPPKVPIPRPQYTPSPPPLHHGDYDPYDDPRYSGYSTSPPPRTSLRPDDPIYSNPGRTPPPMHPTASRPSPDLHYLPQPPRRSSHPDLDRPAMPDTPFFIPPDQRPSTANSYPQPYPSHIIPARPERYSPRPSPPNRHSPPRQRPSPPRHSSQPTPPTQYSSYQKPPRQSPQASPPRQEWRPTPPSQKPLAGPVTSNPPSTSLTSLRHLPYVPILTPTYHRETLDHPKMFAKNGNLKLMVIPAENTTFVAAGEIYGRMDVNSRGEGGSKGKPEILVGELGIELTAYDESRAEAGGSSSRSHLWLLARRTFQVPFNKAAPMDKVTSAIAYPTTITPDDKGYRQPARGTTIFPFRFTVPPDVGSAIECGAEVRTRYTLTAYAKVRILGSFETLIHSVEVDVVERLPFDHIFRNPGYVPDVLSVKEVTDKSFRGKTLSVEASIPKHWWKAGETIPITLELTPSGYKKVGWIKATLVNRVTIHGKAGQSKEVTLDYAVADEKIEDDTDFDPEKVSQTVKLGLPIPKTCRTVSTGLFDVKPYIKVFILHKPLAMPFTISLPAIDIVHPESLATDTEDGETYAGLVRGSYMVREIDTIGDAGKVVTERPGMNPAKGWSYYVDKAGRGKIS